MLYRAPKHDCARCALKLACCPNTPVRKVLRSIREGARGMTRQIAKSREGGQSRRLGHRSFGDTGQTINSLIKRAGAIQVF